MRPINFKPLITKLSYLATPTVNFGQACISNALGYTCLQSCLKSECRQEVNKINTLSRSLALGGPAPWGPLNMGTVLKLGLPRPNKFAIRLLRPANRRAASTPTLNKSLGPALSCPHSNPAPLVTLGQTPTGHGLLCAPWAHLP